MSPRERMVARIPESPTLLESVTVAAFAIPPPLTPYEPWTWWRRVKAWWWR